MPNRPSPQTFERAARRYVGGYDMAQEPEIEQRPVETAVVCFGYDSGAVVNALTKFVRSRFRNSRRSLDLKVISAEREAEEPNLAETQEDSVRRRLKSNKLS